MHAQGFKRYGNPAAVAGSNFTVGDQRADLSRHLLRVGEYRARLRARQ